MSGVFSAPSFSPITDEEITDLKASEKVVHFPQHFPVWEHFFSTSYPQISGIFVKQIAALQLTVFVRFSADWQPLVTQGFRILFNAKRAGFVLVY